MTVASWWYVHVLRIGSVGGLPARIRPGTTIYNQFNRWNHRAASGLSSPPSPHRREYRTTCIQHRSARSAHPWRKGAKIQSGARVVVNRKIMLDRCLRSGRAPPQLTARHVFSIIWWPCSLLADKGYDANNHLRDRLATTKTRGHHPLTSHGRDAYDAKPAGTRNRIVQTSADSRTGDASQPVRQTRHQLRLSCRHRCLRIRA
jgi:hypothetical protein